MKIKSIILKINISEWVLIPTKGDSQAGVKGKVRSYFFLCFKITVIKVKKKRNK